MALIISTHHTSCFRSEEIACVNRLMNSETHKLTKHIQIVFKSGYQMEFICKNLKEAETIFNGIIEAMKNDNNRFDYHNFINNE